MPNLKFEDYGIVGLALAAVCLLAWKILDKFMVGKSDSKSDKSGSKIDNSELKSLIQNNTNVTIELTQFLRTQAEVNKEKEKQSTKQLDTIDTKLNKLVELQTEHMAKCETKCIH
jgi:hypothetical protein